MHRREALKKTSWILKSSVLGPGLFQALQSCRKEASLVQDLKVLTPQQDRLIQAMADTIIPKTDTPGATEVGVNKFLDLLLTDVFEKEVKQHFLEGLEAFEENCQAQTGSSFTELSPNDRHHFLSGVDREIMSQDYGESIPFYYTFKHLTTSIYFSSEQGVKQNLDYQPVPGPYKGEVELQPNDTISIGNHM